MSHIAYSHSSFVSYLDLQLNYIWQIMIGVRVCGSAGISASWDWLLFCWRSHIGYQPIIILSYPKFTFSYFMHKISSFLTKINHEGNNVHGICLADFHFFIYSILQYSQILLLNDSSYYYSVLRQLTSRKIELQVPWVNCTPLLLIS